MLVLLHPGADLGATRSHLHALGLWTTPLSGGDNGGVRALLIVAPSPPVPAARLRDLPGVREVLEAPSPHPLVDAQGTSPAGRGGFALMAGPCAVESEEQIHRIARYVAACGAVALRGGAFKPRTSPYSFAGHGAHALRWLREAADEHGLEVVTEALSEHAVELVAETADVVQIGARNMANYALLGEVGRMRTRVLLKRAPSATVQEWLLAGEHLLRAGAREVIFCERGVRGIDSATRYLLDLSAVALLTHAHGQRVVVDPSHAAGRRDLIGPLALAARAAGAAGVLVETHPEPGLALSDGPQALSPEELDQLARGLGVAPLADAPAPRQTLRG